MYISLLRMLFVVRWRTVRRVDPLYREVLWISVCCDCCVLSGGGLCGWLIPFTEESYGCLLL